jgi:AcrR family transcriptional regulator
MAEDVRVDGRTARAQRTRAAIVEAHLNLIRGGDLRPTGERIAEAAGVSLRTLWASFKDLETLYAASGERMFALMSAERRPIPPDLDLAERAAEYCRQRVRELEILSPVARAAVLREPFSAQLRLNRTVELGRVRSLVVELFGDELAAAGPGAGQLADALVANSSFAVWSVLRDHLGMDVEAATEVLVYSVRALLGVGPVRPAPR